ncbi:hypothetical protein SCP_0900220 [Sparassis crispa]|uniref:DUF6534 domain-containing protein n=1 Tax=Sparassis crispa TaxID=139825 RepID=A0A401GV95_9APHY|nr:hypothetical protein SCP_0900220 [Sparassis crispa]GBE86145.1 hypothetical protein SCP_0900220 [Sparassis crispa]
MSSTQQWPALESCLGAFLIGIIFQSVFYGVVSGLALNYFRRYRRDSGVSIWMKLLVLLAWILCFFSLIVSAHAMYFFVVKNIDDNPMAFSKAPWSVCLLMAVNAVVVVLVRFIFLYRLWRFVKAKGEWNSGWKALLLLTVLLTLVDLSGSLAVSIKLFLTPDTEELEQIKVMVEVVFAAGVSADIFLVGLLCFSLNSSRTGFESTDSLINTLILYAINSGLLPTIVAGAGLATFLVSPSPLVYMAVYNQIANLYLISLIASLNHRKVVRRQVERPFTVDFSPLEACVSAPDVPFTPTGRTDLECGMLQSADAESERALIDLDCRTRPGKFDEKVESELVLSDAKELPSTPESESSSADIGEMMIQACRYS